MRESKPDTALVRHAPVTDKVIQMCYAFKSVCLSLLPDRARLHV